MPGWEVLPAEEMVDAGGICSSVSFNIPATLLSKKYRYRTSLKNTLLKINISNSLCHSHFGTDQLICLCALSKLRPKCEWHSRFNLTDLFNLHPLRRFKIFYINEIHVFIQNIFIFLSFEWNRRRIQLYMCSLWLSGLSQNAPKSSHLPRIAFEAFTRFRACFKITYLCLFRCNILIICSECPDNIFSLQTQFYDWEKVSYIYIKTIKDVLTYLE